VTVNPKPHGYGRYTNGCRCPVCRQAKAAYMRERRAEAARLAAAAPGRVIRRHAGRDVKHGTSFAYYELGCRCTVCDAYAGHPGTNPNSPRRSPRKPT
jgi:rubredoxin